MPDKVVPITGKGGARPRTGPKSKTAATNGTLRKGGAENLDYYSMLAKARAKHEMYRASMAELDYKKRMGDLLEKADIELAATKLHAFLAQSLRSLPDQLEVTLGLSAAQVLQVQDYTDGLCVEIRERLAHVL